MRNDRAGERADTKDIDCNMKIKNVLSDYYAKKVDAEMDQLCEQGIITPSTIEEWGREHMRTAYK